MWIVLHSLVWDGKKSRDDEFGFPLNIVASYFTGGSISDRSALYKEGKDAFQTEFPDGNYHDGYPLAQDRITDPITSLTEISLNDLYNFLTDPSTGAGNLFLSAGFVSNQTYVVYFLILIYAFNLLL